ncbi:hypothetical protein [Kocuria soli]|uniref:hypothetical protein n=1 Tax=Kocuria soli TaxID=2485125 RepID=UPI000F4D6CDE|nr:hypothetical protein [Kocuria soli]
MNPRDDGASRGEQASPRARLVRGWLAAVLSTLCAATGHYAVAAHAPDLRFLGIAFVAAGFVSVFLASHRLGPVRTVLLVGAGQGAFHAVFSAQGGATAQVSAGAHDHAMLQHHTHMTTSTAVEHSTGGAMLLAHVLATVATYVLVRFGERTCWAVVDAWCARAVGLVRWRPTPHPGPRRVGRFDWPAPHHLVASRWFMTAHARRGPPLPEM